MEKLLIVDGTALLFQSFYGMPNKIKNQNGEYIEAVICFFGILTKIIKLLSPNKLLVVFDGDNKLERQEVLPNYKANRIDYSMVDEVDNPFIQLELIKRVLDYVKYSYIETMNMEADDYIAGMVNTLKNHYKIYISSPDKDFIQLLDVNVVQFIYRGKLSNFLTCESVLDNYGFEAKYFNTFKALIGDASDNIKGLYKVGVKTASSLIREYKTLENIINNVENIKPKLGNLIKENVDLLRKNFQVINLQNIYFDKKEIPKLDFFPTDLSLMQILQKI